MKFCVFILFSLIFSSEGVYALPAATRFNLENFPVPGYARLVERRHIKKDQFDQINFSATLDYKSEMIVEFYKDTLGKKDWLICRSGGDDASWESYLGSDDEKIDQLITHFVSPDKKQLLTIVMKHIYGREGDKNRNDAKNRGQQVVLVLHDHEVLQIIGMLSLYCTPLNLRARSAK